MAHEALDRPGGGVAQPPAQAQPGAPEVDLQSLLAEMSGASLSARSRPPPQPAAPRPVAKPANAGVRPGADLRRPEGAARPSLPARAPAAAPPAPPATAVSPVQRCPEATAGPSRPKAAQPGTEVVDVEDEYKKLWPEDDDEMV